MTIADIGDMDVSDFNTHAKYAAAVIGAMGVSIPE